MSNTDQADPTILATVARRFAEENVKLYAHISQLLEVIGALRPAGGIVLLTDPRAQAAILTVELQKLRTRIQETVNYIGTAGPTLDIGQVVYQLQSLLEQHTQQSGSDELSWTMPPLK